MNTPLQHLLAFYGTRVRPSLHTLVVKACSTEPCEGWYNISRATFACENLDRNNAKLLREYLRSFREQLALLTLITHLLGARADSFTHRKRCEVAISLSPPHYRETLMQGDNLNGLATCLGKLWKDDTDWRYLHADLADHEYPILRLLDYIQKNPAAIDRALWPPTLAEAS